MPYNNELVNSMRPLCNELQNNNDLYKLMITGDKIAKDAMIINNYRLVLSIVEKYITGLPQFKHLQDDLVGEGLLGLTIAVNAMAENKNKPVNVDPTSFMSRSMRNHIINYIRENNSDDISFEEPSESDNLTDMSDELKEEILSCCSEDELPIIELWIGGNTVREIAKLLNFPSSNNGKDIYRIIKTVKTRITVKLDTGKSLTIK
jgi:RNA polymerase sigma factor (sigma-70 family)